MLGQRLLHKTVNNLISLLLLTGLCFWPSGSLLAKQADILPPSYYASEFFKFTRQIELHLEQLDKCLAEMDRFEAGEVFSESVECPKFDAMVYQMQLEIDDYSVLFESYLDTIEGFNERGTQPRVGSERGPEADSLRKIEPATEIVASLMEKYMEKFSILQIQTQRVRKLELILLRDVETKVTGFDFEQEVGMGSEADQQSAQKFIRKTTANLLKKRRASCITATLSTQYCECVDQHLVWIADWENFSGIVFMLSQLPQSKLETYLSQQTQTKRMFIEHLLTAGKRCESLKQ